MIQKIKKMLFRQGYRPLFQENDRILVKDFGGMNGLVCLVPPPLPGQPAIQWDSLRTMTRKRERDLMVKTGKPAYSLLLVFSADLPSVSMIQALASIENAWVIDQADRRLMIFESQFEDFFGLREKIEEVLEQANEEKTGRLTGDWKQFFEPVNLLMILINLLVFFVLSMLGNTLDPTFMVEHGAGSWIRIVEEGEYWRLLTSGFLHFGIHHLFHNMLALILIGSQFEKYQGHVTYFAVYMLSELMSALTSLFVTLAGDPYSVSAGASGAVFGIIGAFLATALFDILFESKRGERKIGRVGFLLMLAVAFVSGVTSPEVDIAAHAGGLVTGFLVMILVRLIRWAFSQVS